MKPETRRNLLLFATRFVAAGALLLAGYLKATGNPLAFKLSIDSFKLAPEVLHWPLAYYLPALELLLGMTLLLGLWARASALLAAGLLGAFTLGLASVILRGMKVDCGCFGGLFGEATVGWSSIARNAIFVAAAMATVIFGGGRWAIMSEQPRNDKPLP